MKIILYLVSLILSTSVWSEEISFEIYELTDDGRNLIHKEKLIFNQEDIAVFERNSGLGKCSDYRLVLWKKFGINSCVYKESEITGFGLSIDKNHGGFSWEWFSRSGGCKNKNPEDRNLAFNVYKKLQGSGSIKIEFIEDGDIKEMISFEFLEDATMRGKLGFFGSLGGGTHHIVIKKGSVLRIAKFDNSK